MHPIYCLMFSCKVLTFDYDVAVSIFLLEHYGPSGGVLGMITFYTPYQYLIFSAALYTIRHFSFRLIAFINRRNSGKQLLMIACDSSAEHLGCWCTPLYFKEYSVLMLLCATKSTQSCVLSSMLSGLVIAL
jgi:hypothetical protein